MVVIINCNALYLECSLAMALAARDILLLAPALCPAPAPEPGFDLLLVMASAQCLVYFLCIQNYHFTQVFGPFKVI